MIISLKDLSPAQQRLLNDMVGTQLRKTPQGWFAKSVKPHADSTRQKLLSVGFFQQVNGAFAYELTPDAHDLATGIRATVGEA